VQIAALLVQSDVEHARVREAISDLRVDGAVLAKKGARIKIEHCGCDCASSPTNACRMRRPTGMGSGITPIPVRHSSFRKGIEAPHADL